MSKISVVLEQDTDGGTRRLFRSSSGCQSQASPTVEEALANIREAIDVYLETI